MFAAGIATGTIVNENRAGPASGVIHPNTPTAGAIRDAASIAWPDVFRDSLQVLNCWETREGATCEIRDLAEGTRGAYLADEDAAVLRSEEDGKVTYVRRKRANLTPRDWADILETLFEGGSADPDRRIATLVCDALKGHCHGSTKPLVDPEEEGGEG